MVIDIINYLHHFLMISYLNLLLVVLLVVVDNISNKLQNEHNKTSR